MRQRLIPILKYFVVRKCCDNFRNVCSQARIRHSLPLTFAMPAISVTPRLNGLDTLRAIAIVLVVLYHTTINVTHAPTFGPLGTAGWAGVDLFFVLSGYLTGNQILSALAGAQSFSLLQFYARRLLRTLPNFYVVLMLYFVIPLTLGGNPPPALWRFFELHAKHRFALWYSVLARLVALR